MNKMELQSFSTTPPHLTVVHQVGGRRGPSCHYKTNKARKLKFDVKLKTYYTQLSFDLST